MNNDLIGLLTLIYYLLMCMIYLGAIYVSQTLQFKAPVCIGDKLLTEVQALELREYMQKYRFNFLNSPSLSLSFQVYMEI